ncbi:hypothetical protein WJX73_003653 [Symbiochloris irregularis]|uniref:NADH-cytochrome b5 reductase n=1 Tax=Symbiochloris irregularis TaxID=706552 RepID=A0AAW1P9J8_9CHLO
MLGLRLFSSRAVGALAASVGAATVLKAYSDSPARAEAEAPGALNPDEWRAFKLRSKEQVTHDTTRFRFDLPDKNQTFGLHVASCFVTRAAVGDEKEDGSKKFVIRPYTPCSEPTAKGYFDLVIKVYPGGKISNHVLSLKEGDELECKGPINKLEYKPNMKKSIGMIAGGSGLTPMLQVIQAIVGNPEDKTKVTFLFANKTEEDIILRKELDELAKKHDNLKIHYVVDKASSKDWKYTTGHVNKELVQQQLPPPGSDSLILVCGPPPMMKAISGDKVSPKDQGELSGVLKDAGFTKEQVYKF